MLAKKGMGKTMEELLDLDVLEEAMAVRAAIQIRDTAVAVRESKAKPQEIENDLFAQMKINMIKSHMHYLAFHIFRQQYTTHPWKDARIKPLLDDVARVGALS